MGNANQAASVGELGLSKMKGWPIAFHDIHSDNIQLSSDRRRAKRIETFCKGICFSGRPVKPNEHVYLRFSEVSTSWSGALRFGFMSHDPTLLDKNSLPRYACPDLTNSPGYWAKALPERLARHGSVMLFYVTPAGDVMFGINGEDKGVFFGGINTKVPLWALLDIYGNTVSIEFVDGYQLNNASSNSARPQSTVSLDGGMLDWFASSVTLDASAQPARRMTSSTSSTALLAVRSLPESILLPFSFNNAVVGRNICLSFDGCVAVRRVEDYCNAYVFTRRPFRPCETLVIQVLSVDSAYTGGLAFGMTCCDPSILPAEALPDDSDLLLDRPEYWIVNKDVCANAEVGDELTFHLTEEGQVRYSRNGRYLSTLMHIDKTLPMWAFYDVYGSIQKIKMLGVIDGPPPWEQQFQQPDLTLSLPPVSVLKKDQNDTGNLPPPRPPPPQSSPTTFSTMSSRALPSLPPKQHKSVASRPTSDSPSRDPSMQLIQAPFGVAATAFPAPPSQAVATMPHNHRHHPHRRSGVSSQSLPHPQSRSINSRTISGAALPGSRSTTDSSASLVDRSELADNASNECSVCLEKPSDCVLYMCGHMCMCYECAINIRRTDGATCPICRQLIRDVIKIFRA